MALRLVAKPPFIERIEQPLAPVRERRAGTGFSWAGPLEVNIEQWPTEDSDRWLSNSFSRVPIVYACITMIASSAAEAPLRAMQGVDAAREAQEGTPLAALLERPNKRQQWFSFAEQFHVYQQATGNAFIFKIRGAGGQVTELRLLRSGRMHVIPGTDGPKAWIYRINGQDYPIAPEDIIHCPLVRGTDDFYGLSPLHVLARHTGLDVAMTTFHEAVFRNGGMVTGLITYDRELDDDEPEQIRSAWRKRFSGSNAGNIAILEGGATYQQVGLDLDKMAMTDLKHISESAICGAFGVPPSSVFAMIGLLRNTFSNAQEEQVKFWMNTLMPNLKRMCGALTIGLELDFPGDWQLEADTSEIRALQENEDSRHARALSDFNGGGITRDQFLLAIGEDPIGGRAGSVYRIPTNLEEQTAEEINKPPEPPMPVVMPGALPPDHPQNELPSGTKPPSRQIEAPPNQAVATRSARRALHPREQSAVERLRTIRDPYVDPTAAEIEKYHQKLADNASGILGSHYKDGEVRGIHGYPFDSGHLVPHASDAHLAQILRSGMEPVMRDTWNTINDSGLVGHMDYANRAAPEAFDPMRPSVQHILNNSYSTAVDINDATRKAIDEMLALGGERGYTVKQLAEGVPTDMFPGVKSLITETYKNRALAIARTELGRAQVASQRARYAAADVAQVEIQDGGGPTSCEECDARDGDVVDLASEVDLLHPNCIVSTLPVLPEFGAAGGA